MIPDLKIMLFQIFQLVLIVLSILFEFMFIKLEQQNSQQNLQLCPISMSLDKHFARIVSSYGVFVSQLKRRFYYLSYSNKINAAVVLCSVVKSMRARFDFLSRIRLYRYLKKLVCTRQLRREINYRILTKVLMARFNENWERKLQNGAIVVFEEKWEESFWEILWNYYVCITDDMFELFVYIMLICIMCLFKFGIWGLYYVSIASVYTCIFILNASLYGTQFIWNGIINNSDDITRYLYSSVYWICVYMFDIFYWFATLYRFSRYLVHRCIFEL